MSKEKAQLRKYLVGGGIKDNKLALATLHSFKELHAGEEVSHGGLLWEVIGELPQ